MDNKLIVTSNVAGSLTITSKEEETLQQQQLVLAIERFSRINKSTIGPFESLPMFPMYRVSIYQASLVQCEVCVRSRS